MRQINAKRKTDANASIGITPTSSPTHVHNNILTSGSTLTVNAARKNEKRTSFKESVGVVTQPLTLRVLAAVLDAFLRLW
jgi:hypothetical protein